MRTPKLLRYVTTKLYLDSIQLNNINPAYYKLDPNLSHANAISIA